MAEQNRQKTLEKQAELMTMFDTRLYRNLGGIEEDGHTFYPFMDYGSYVTDWHETVSSLDMAIWDAEESVDSKDKDNAISLLKKRQDMINTFNTENYDQYLAPRSLIHPYAVVKLAGASGSPEMLASMPLHDAYYKRRFYEIDGEFGYSGHYAKNPTTTSLIKWGNESKRGTTPYSFQDFVFCKWWNKIENNRLITLRRYAMPVTDNIEFSDYDVSEKAGDKDNSATLKGTDDNGKEVSYSGINGTKPWVPLATAVTYFGKETGNEISKLLSFSAKYGWEETKDNGNNPIDVTSSQNEAGSNLVSSDFSAVSSGLGVVARFMGVLGDIQNGKTLNMDAVTGVPPDPYKDGPYENRILGPLNVIQKVHKRKRGLEFVADGLKLNFEYIARPIAGINNKAVLLDLLSNILVLGYSSGTWFGGMHRYRCDSPAMYPWKYGDAMNKMHRGQLFGPRGAVQSLTKHVYEDGKSLISTFLPDLGKMISGLFTSAVEGVKSFLGKDDAKNESERKKATESFQSALNTGTAKTIQKLIAAKATRGTSVPYIHGNRALLTGEPVGDWHLTIGNPFNPIAMIGNLIVTDLQVDFYDELGPDDFPIGFKATITLKHGMGRDRDSIESMFNRGFGRIYTLPSDFRSSADGETKVDSYTGTGGKPRKGYSEIRQTYYGGGTRGIMDIKTGPLSTKGSMYKGDVKKLPSLHPTDSKKHFALSTYFVNPWQMAMNM